MRLDSAALATLSKYRDQREMEGKLPDFNQRQRDQFQFAGFHCRAIVLLR